MRMLNIYNRYGTTSDLKQFNQRALYTSSFLEKIAAVILKGNKFFHGNLLLKLATHIPKKPSEVTFVTTNKRAVE